MATIVRSSSLSSPHRTGSPSPGSSPPILPLRSRVSGDVPGAPGPLPAGGAGGAGGSDRGVAVIDDVLAAWDNVEQTSVKYYDCLVRLDNLKKISTIYYPVSSGLMCSSMLPFLSRYHGLPGGASELEELVNRELPNTEEMPGDFTSGRARAKSQRSRQPMMPRQVYTNAEERRTTLQMQIKNLELELDYAMKNLTESVERYGHKDISRAVGEYQREPRNGDLRIRVRKAITTAKDSEMRSLQKKRELLEEEAVIAISEAEVTKKPLDRAFIVNRLTIAVEHCKAVHSTISVIALEHAADEKYIESKRKESDPRRDSDPRAPLLMSGTDRKYDLSTIGSVEETSPVAARAAMLEKTDTERSFRGFAFGDDDEEEEEEVQEHKEEVKYEKMEKIDIGDLNDSSKSMLRSLVLQLFPMLVGAIDDELDSLLRAALRNSEQYESVGGVKPFLDLYHTLEKIQAKVHARFLV